MNQSDFDLLLEEIKKVIESNNSNIIRQYFQIGKLIVEKQVDFPSREKLLKDLSAKLGQGYGRANLSETRRLYEAYKEQPEQFELATQIGWSHNRKLLSIENDSELRNELLIATIKEKLSENELENRLRVAQYQKKIENEGFKIHIESIEIKNFKSIVDLKLEKPNPFSVFVGSNACGKSNIFAAIDLLFDSYSINPKTSFNNFGGVQILNFSKKNENLTISLNSGLKEKITFSYDAQKDMASKNEIKEPYLEKLTNQYTYLFIEREKNESKKLILEKDGSNYKTILKNRILSDPPSRDAFLRNLNDAVANIEDVKITEENGSDELYVEDKNYSGVKIPENLLSEGTRKLMILLTAIFQNKEPQFVCIEEPENGIHPLVIGPFIDTIRTICEDEGHYIWFTSHSTTLMRHLKREEMVVVDIRAGQTKIKKASDKEFDSLFENKKLRMDDALLTGLLGGGLPW